MSYDVCLTIDTGGDGPAALDGTEQNYTYNCSPMFRAALGGKGLYELAGKPGGLAAQMLGHAIGQMVHHREKYEAMNPENGWGDYSSAVKFLERLRADCLAHPKALVEVS